MSTRPNIKPYQSIPNAQASPANTTSMAASITGAPTILSNVSLVSYSFAWTGSSPSGTISLQGSNDYSLNPNGSVLNAGSWDALTLNYQGNAVTSITISGNSGSGLIDITATGIYAIRPVYTRSSGTGDLTVTVVAKCS